MKGRLESGMPLSFRREPPVMAQGIGSDQPTDLSAGSHLPLRETSFLLALSPLPCPRVRAERQIASSAPFLLNPFVQNAVTPIWRDSISHQSLRGHGRHGPLRVRFPPTSPDHNMRYLQRREYRKAIETRVDQSAFLRIRTAFAHPPRKTIEELREKTAIKLTPRREPLGCS